MFFSTTAEKVTKRFGSIVERLSILKADRSQKSNGKKDSRGLAVLVTSGKRKEGRTTVAFGLAVSTASLHPSQKVLLVELDHRNPSINDLMSIPKNSTGIYDIVHSDTPAAECVKKTNLDNLHVLAQGTQELNILEDLQSDSFKNRFGELREEYDYIFVDAPNINEHVDARLILDQTDGAVLVIRSERSKKDETITAKKYISDEKLFGAVVNDYRNPIPSFLAKQL